MAESGGGGQQHPGPQRALCLSRSPRAHWRTAKPLLQRAAPVRFISPADPFFRQIPDCFGPGEIESGIEKSARRHVHANCRHTRDTLNVMGIPFPMQTRFESRGNDTWMTSFQLFEDAHFCFGVPSTQFSGGILPVFNVIWSYNISMLILNLYNYSIAIPCMWKYS